MLQQNEKIHAYWDNLLTTSVYFISEATEAYEPTGPLKWFKLPAPYSIGNYGPFGFNYRVSQRYECLSVDCDTNHVCGLGSNSCEKDQPLAVNVTGGSCDCIDPYYGHFCEFQDDVSFPVFQD
jgi:hypothetical protein